MATAFCGLCITSHLTPIQLPDGAVRAAAHGDINLITLLMGASAEGLEVLRRDGKWIAITALPDQIIVNVGDMLDRLTNHNLKSTIHRVVNPSREKE
jgi:isopenicillin N synthase-like dioxygenase